MTLIKKYDLDLMRHMNLFETVSKIRPKDCFTDNIATYFFVKKGSAKIAIGKQGINIKKIETALNKKVKVIEYADNPEELIKNYLFAIKPLFVKKTNNVIEIKFKFAKQRRYLLDNSQLRMKELLKLTQYYWPEINEIKVL